LAEAALQRAAAVEGVLHWVATFAAGCLVKRAQALNRRDLFAFCEASKEQAGEHGLSIEEDRASAAVALVAALLCPSQADSVAEDFTEGPVFGGADFDAVPVDLKSQVLHGAIV